jgi:hypothetical protein
MEAAKAPNSLDGEIVASDNGNRLHLYSPILGTVCSRCAKRPDDVSFVLETGDHGRSAGGLCARCMIELLQTVMQTE